MGAVHTYYPVGAQPFKYNIRLYRGVCIASAKLLMDIPGVVPGLELCRTNWIVLLPDFSFVPPRDEY